MLASSNFTIVGYECDARLKLSCVLLIKIFHLAPHFLNHLQNNDYNSKNCEQG